MRQIGAKGKERPVAMAPLLAYCAIAVVVMIAVVLLFKLAGIESGWIPFAVGGGVIGGLLSVVYPWLYDRLGPDRGPGA